MKTRLTFVFALLLACTGAAAVHALGTPDGLPPAVETVCDGESGAAFGLCNAYCEAMDCDSPAPHASATACSKVRSHFQRITGHDIPCAMACPCQSMPAFNADLAGITECSADPDTVVFAQDPDVHASFASTQGEGGGACGTYSGPGIAIPITEEQAALCIQVVLAAAASHNVTCTPF